MPVKQTLTMENQMDALELGLPLHLYSERRSPDGVVTQITYAADKLVTWATAGRGDAIEKLCRQNYEQDIEAIFEWQENQYLLLDETWAAIENGVNDDENEAQHVIACKAVSMEADEKRGHARTLMDERKAGLVKLLQQSKENLAANQPAVQEGGSGGYLFVLLIAGVLAYVLLA